MTDIAGLRVVTFRTPPSSRISADRALALIQQAAENQGRWIRRYVEKLITACIVGQDYDRLDRLYVRDEFWSETGPSVASTLRAGRFR